MSELTERPVEGIVGREGDAWLCIAHGETDRPCVTLATDRTAVQRFIVDQWLGDAGDAQLPEIMATFDEHDWSDGELKWEFEIGGVEINDVFNVTPNAEFSNPSSRNLNHE